MRALLINPWIYDFAAYDFWLKPLGLLRIASVISQWGWGVDYLDCLNRCPPRRDDPPGGNIPRADPFGCGHYLKVEVEKPASLRSVERRYFRYGIPLERFQEELARLDTPDLILVGSTMTYWYPGYFLAIELLQKAFPRTPSVLGGLYPQLCPRHASTYSGATALHTGGGIFTLRKLLRDLGFSLPPELSQDSPEAAFELLPDRSALVLQTSRGCPFGCSYCAIPFLEPQIVQREPEKVVDEIAHYILDWGTEDLAFYDSALLYHSSFHLDRILTSYLNRGLTCRFHTPNGIHARFLSEKTAHLMHQSGFATIRLSLETSQPQRQQSTGGKVKNRELVRALKILRNAGFKTSEIGVYILMGLPQQSLSEVEQDIDFVHNLGAPVYLAAYSPIPGTKDYALLEKAGIIERDMDPLWQNNTIFILRQKGFDLEAVRDLRKRVSSRNLELKSTTPC